MRQSNNMREAGLTRLDIGAVESNSVKSPPLAALSRLSSFSS